MKNENTIKRRIKKYEDASKKFKNDKTLDPVMARRARKTLKLLVRELKWTLK